MLDLWDGPPDSGAAVACLATTFTFDAEFFDEECLGRFLGLTTARIDPDGGGAPRVTDIAAVLEHEERLAETQVSVITDAGATVGPRNLRWDLMTVRNDDPLLHSKVVVLIWERVVRIIVSSANLTRDGYRSNAEFATSLEIRPESASSMARSQLHEIADHLESVLAQVGPAGGMATTRARNTLTLLRRRIDLVDEASDHGLRVTAAPADGSRRALDGWRRVWAMALPTTATIISPFWDKDPTRVLRAVASQLTGRPASDRSIVIAVDPVAPGIDMAAVEGALLGVNVSFKEWTAPAETDATDDGDPTDSAARSTVSRRLHGKCIVLESRDWIAALVGSSNATSPGLGMAGAASNTEFNLWFGARRDSDAGKALVGLTRLGRSVRPEDAGPPPDDQLDDVRGMAEIPVWISACQVLGTTPATLSIDLDVATVPLLWHISLPGGARVASSDEEAPREDPSRVVVEVDDILPAFVEVRWRRKAPGSGAADGDLLVARVPVIVADLGLLPPPAELAALPVHVLLAALASSRPLPVALALELARREQGSAAGTTPDTDPLKIHDDRTSLLRRARLQGTALAAIEDRLKSPVASRDALRWRLFGPIGPVSIGRALARSDDAVAMSGAEFVVPGEAAFLIAELARSVHDVDWGSARQSLGRRVVNDLVDEALHELERLAADLELPHGDVIGDYVARTFAELGR